MRRAQLATRDEQLRVLGIAGGRNRICASHHHMVVPTPLGECIEHGAHPVFGQVLQRMAGQQLAPSGEAHNAHLGLNPQLGCCKAHIPLREPALCDRLMDQLHHIGVAGVFFEPLVEREDDGIFTFHDLQKAALVVNQETRDLDPRVVAGCSRGNSLKGLRAEVFMGLAGIDQLGQHSGLPLIKRASERHANSAPLA